MDISQERLYVMTNDDKNNVYLAMMAKVGVPDEKASISYNGSEHALLLRDNESIVVLDYIPEKMQEALKKVSSVNVVETLSDFKSVVRRYDVKVNQSKGPYPKNVLDTIQSPEEFEKIQKL